MRKGRKPKPIAAHIAEGTYRPTRHGLTDLIPQPDGVPEMPEMDLEESREFWTEYVPPLIDLGIATAADAPRLQNMCELWGLLRVSTAIVNKDPTDKDARIAFAEYSRQFQRASDEFGLTPVSRMQIRTKKGDSEKPKPSIAPRSRG